MNESFYCSLNSDLLEYRKYFNRGQLINIPDYIFQDAKYLPLREYALFHMGFSVVTLDNCKVLKELIKGGRVLEIMCGLGAYSYALRKLGCQVIATDDMSWMADNACKYLDWKTNTWIDDTESIDAVGAIKKYGANVDFILMSWPPQNEDFALNALLTMREENPNCRMIYIGEEKKGCTADDAFFDALVDVSVDYDCISRLRETYHCWISDSYYDKQFIIR